MLCGKYMMSVELMVLKIIFRTSNCFDLIAHLLLDSG